jgi:hypothetical protein
MKLPRRQFLHLAAGAAGRLALCLGAVDAVAAATGEHDTARWPGHAIELYPTTTKMKGETVTLVTAPTLSPSPGSSAGMAFDIFR